MKCNDHMDFLKIGIAVTICILFITSAFSSGAIGFAGEIEELDNQQLSIEHTVASNSKTLAGRGIIDINPTDDAQVAEGNPTSNYGSATYLYVQSAAYGASSFEDERAWTKFDINGVIPSEYLITSAILRLYCWKADGPTMDASVHGSLDDSWNEMIITWNNQPSYEAELDSIQLTEGQIYVWKEWDVTSFVQSQWSDDKIVSLVVKPTAEDASPAKTFAFDPKEYSSGSYAPILSIAYTDEGVNDPPVVDDIPDQTTSTDDSFTQIYLDAYVDDPDNFDSQITWTYSGNVELVVDIDSGTRIATITASSPEWTGQESITFRATDPGLLCDEDTATFTVTNYGWIEVSTSPYIHSYAVGVACAGEYVILANGETSSSSKIMKYNISSDLWETFTNSPYHFKNSVAMEWDGNNYVYTLFGGSYSDCRNQVRHYFSRFNIDTNNWENLPDSPWYQGPGDAITWVKDGDNEYIYALLGSSSCSGAPWGYPGPPYPDGVQFWRYNVSSNVWDQQLNSISYGSDDGADLVWTGGNYIYAFCGAYNEGLPKDEERHFLRYNISDNSWLELENTPYKAAGGIDDGGSLLYPGYGNYIYALKGGDDGAGGGGSPGDDFWRYSISNDSWEIMPSIPAGVGDQNGHRLGFSNGKIYCWRGCFSDGTLWEYQNGFTMDGEIFESDGITPVSGSEVTITNLNASKEWTATVASGSNYYALFLDSGKDISEGDELRIMAKKNLDEGVHDPDGYTYSINVAYHDITQTDIDNNGIFDFDLTLDNYCINYASDYQYFTQEQSEYSGAAVLQMWTDFKGVGPYGQGQLQIWGLENNTQADIDNSLPYIDPQGMAMTLRGLVGDYIPSGHTFVVGVMPNSTEGLSWAMHRICWWQYTGPGALPTGGDYANWMSVRGIHTDKRPQDGVYNGTGDWEYDVYGFWINDPDNSPGSIGANSYKTAYEWTTHYYDIIMDPNNPLWDGKYITVLEPPEYDAEVNIVPARSRLIRTITPILMEKSIKIRNNEKTVLVKTIEDEEALDVVKAAIDGVTEELIPYDSGFAAAFEKTIAGGPLYVNDDDAPYYIVPFNAPVYKIDLQSIKPVTFERIGKENIELVSISDKKLQIATTPIIKPVAKQRTLIVVLVDAEDGSFKEASWVTNPSKYLPISQGKALEIVFDLLKKEIDMKSKFTDGIRIELVNRDSLPYYPDWKITIKDKVFFVGQDGAVSN